jgi:hypothetical protein
VLLVGAQQVGAVRSDITGADLHVIIGGALTMEDGLPPASRGKGLQVVIDGLRAR